ncbi:hypothetical protein A2310_03600 [candidate division WOR-1 bacterium RIFOXYB2_FULL_37_13]|uniref:Uncharacterized protein n=1 Tax=candidate division WOR-1 bacterium RIFOXYB2_FULL_37_13 TaxID=1802579 RepID=A0A1F4SDX9_UNCSA|nr:MAG: hypothetical protein A2310_03600 [candidate division WOR-1 bacterium RIFOXYB2_FULL_37_13]
MKIKAIWILIPFLFVAITGCSDLANIADADYYRISVSSTNDSYPIYYTAKSLNNENLTGYEVVPTLPGPSFTFASAPKEITTASIILPQITFNHMLVTYEVTQDTQGILGTWTPSRESLGVNIVIPAGTNTSSIAITDQNIASRTLAIEVFNKIGTVSADLQAAGTYVFYPRLSTSLSLRAYVLLTGTDARGEGASLSFSTTLYFAASSS